MTIAIARNAMTTDNRTNEPSEALTRVEKFLDGVHGLNEMNVVRGIRKAIAGEETTFQHEVRLNVYGAPCGHTPPSHFPSGYGECKPCRYPDLYDEEDYDDESRW